MAQSVAEFCPHDHVAEDTDGISVCLDCWERLPFIGEVVTVIPSDNASAVIEQLDLIRELTERAYARGDHHMASFQDGFVIGVLATLGIESAFEHPDVDMAYDLLNSFADR